MAGMIRQYLKDLKGATAIEYGMIAGILSIVILAALLFAGPELADLFNNIGTDLGTVNAQSSS